MARTRRSESQQFILYTQSDNERGWKRTRRISFEQGEQRVAAGLSVRAFDEHQNHIGYWILKQEQRPASADVGLPNLPGSTQFSRNEVEAIAGLMGTSRTEGMHEELRVTRTTMHGVPLPPEDLVERAGEKLELWPFPAPGRGDKAVRVYPKVPARAR